VHGLLSGAVALITVTGRRTGRAYTTPVMYARDGDDLYTYVGSPERKTWWRNLREPQLVRVVVAGREFGAVAGVLDPAAQPDQVRAGLRAYARAFPRAFRRLRIDPEGFSPRPGDGVPDKTGPGQLTRHPMPSECARRCVQADLSGSSRGGWSHWLGDRRTTHERRRVRCPATARRPSGESAGPIR
jgi:deazaflavin-dependent oxidoreductase (nitroreductase family)